MMYKMDISADKILSDCDLTDYGMQLLYRSLESDCILYTPTNSLLNYVLLEVLKRNVTANGHILIIAPSNYAAKQHSQFLNRHFLSGSIGCGTDIKYEDLWPKVIVGTISTISQVMKNNQHLKLDMIFVLECNSAMQNETVQGLVSVVKQMESDKRPRIQCFTSCFESLAGGSHSIDQLIQTLEEFYGCKIASSCDQFAIERIFFDTVPLVDSYEVQGNFQGLSLEALQLLKEVENFCSNFQFCLNDKFSEVSEDSCEIFVKKIILKVQELLEEYGAFGGSIAALAALRDLVRLHTFTDAISGIATRHCLSYYVCTLVKFRKLLEEEMFRKQLCERAEHFSSSWVQCILRHVANMPKSHRALIMVQQPNRASILTSILQEIFLQNKKYAQLKAELLMNSSLIPLSESWEDILSWERNMEIYSRFVLGKSNIVVLSGEPQGLDLPLCDVVVVHDEIEHFSLFLQAKNHVKRKGGKLIFLTNKVNLTTYKERINQFESMERTLKQMMTANVGPPCSDQHTSPSFFRTPSGIELQGNKLIETIFWYCENLPCDKLSPCKPIWKMERSVDDTTAYCATLVLPQISPVHKVKSKKMVSWEAAQQDAALQACQRLHQMNEISDSTLISWQTLTRQHNPKNILGTKSCIGTKFLTELKKHLGLPNLNLLSEKDESSDDEDILCDISFPLSFTGTQPRPGTKIYVHKINIKPVSEPPPPGDNRKTVLYELLCDRNSFAILSTGSLFKVCQFPVFMFGHELSVDIETLGETLVLDHQEIIRLRVFHCGLFMNILPIVQNFMQFDVFNTHNSYLIAPISAEGIIDWNTVDKHFTIPECRPLTHEEKEDLVCSPESHERTIIKPWYRHLAKDQVYLVSSVCLDMNAESCFPTDDFESFVDYYREKYKILLQRPELPLLEAYLLNTKVNGLLPRLRTHKMRREEKMEDFREHMLPELCVSLLFPAAYWLKLSCLPSVLHRLNRLLVVEELRRLLAYEAGAGAQEIELQALRVDLSRLNEKPNGPEVPPSTVKRGLAIGNVKLQHRRRLAQLKKPWGTTQEPVDIQRQMESLNFVEIRYYDKFVLDSTLVHLDPSQVSSPAASDDDFDSESENTDSCCSVDENYPRCLPIKEEGPPQFITLLRACGEEYEGPQQSELLEVLTSSASNDAVNMDRIQVLGNAFLKLVISVYSYQCASSFPGSKTSTSLFQIRKAFMSRSNLETYAVRKKLCNRLKVLDFTPGEWMPPCFVTPRWLKEVLVDQEISPNVLLQIHLTDEEQLSGIINEDSQDEVLEVLENFVNRGIAGREEVYIDRQHVPHQVASSCVEALVGTYFRSCGWQGALKIVGWLDMLPAAKLEGLLDCKEPQDKVSISSQLAYLLSDVPLSLEALELNLYYNFNDKKLLVQAVTHESFVSPLFNGSMDTLTFLGSGILDFLLTSYIFEHFTEMSPPHLWRLREILTSTSTLAFLAVRHDMHKHLLHNSSLLLDAIDRFVKGQRGCLHSIDDKVQLLLEEDECESAMQIEVPDALAKLIPALVGAVYLDNNNNLASTWSTFSKIFLPELGIWRQEVPLNVVDLLKDLSPAAHQVIFSTKASELFGIEVTCRILMDNTREEVFVAHGFDEMKTKTHAAKLALRNLLGIISFNH